ncbi:hypothetical protein TURU_083811 [Turdus rufiventris]|nr:hypothetical protein TURU_083811 [Turdus rufiventris]
MDEPEEEEEEESSFVLLSRAGASVLNENPKKKALALSPVVPCWLVAMSGWAGLLSTTARVILLLLLGSLLFSCSSLGHRAPEFALTKIEERDIKDASGEELVTEDDADPEDLEVFYPTDQWQTLRADLWFSMVLPGDLWFFLRISGSPQGSLVLHADL